MQGYFTSIFLALGHSDEAATHTNYLLTAKKRKNVGAAENEAVFLPFFKGSVHFW